MSYDLCCVKYIKMNSLESVEALLLEHLVEASIPIEPSIDGTEMRNYILISGSRSRDYKQRVYDCFFNWITDPSQSPESIIYLLDTYIRELHGFSTNKSIQTLVYFPCLEALARRRPAVLQGPWEKVAWIIIKYSKCSNTILDSMINDFKAVNEATVKWIVESSVPELCPNPCLRLELFRLMRSFNRNKFEYDRILLRVNVISTIFEVLENYSPLTMEQLPNLSPMNLEYIIRDNKIGMAYLMNDLDLYPIRFDIIIAVLKLTRNLALLEKERQLSSNSSTQRITFEVWNTGIKIQLSACLSFCGLIPLCAPFPRNKEELETEYKDRIYYFKQAIGDDTFLLNIMMHTLNTITDLSLCFPDEHALHDSVAHEKDKLLNTFVKDHVNQLPTYQHLLEIYGGF